MKLRALLLSISRVKGIMACSSDDHDDPQATEISPVNFDLSKMPYETLSDYNFFKGN